MSCETFVCSVCHHLWLVPRAHIASPGALWCNTCCAPTGCIVEATRPHDTQPGPAADLFEAVMLDWLAGVPVPELAVDTLRFALGLDLAPESV